MTRHLKRDGLNPIFRGRSPAEIGYIPLQDYAGRSAMVSKFGDLIVAERRDDISVQFQYNIATADVTTTLVGGGSVSVSESRAVLSTAAGVSTTTLESVNVIRYRPGHEAFAFFTAALDDAGVGVEHRIGPWDDNDGFFFGSIDGVFGVGRRRDGVETFTPSSGFSHDTLVGERGSAFTIDWSDLGIRRISWGYLGIAPIDFEVFGDASRGFIPAHTIDLTGAGADTSILNPVLPIRAQVKRTSGSGVAQLRTASWNGGTCGPPDEEIGNRHFSAYSAKSVTGAVRTNLLTISNPTTFQSKTNRVRLNMDRLTVATDGTKTVEVAIFEDATLGGSPSYSAIDATNSVTTVDTAGTTVTGGTRVATWTVGKAEGRDFILRDDAIRLKPGHTFTLAVLTANASDVSASLRWHEEF